MTQQDKESLAFELEQIAQACEILGVNLRFVIEKITKEIKESEKQ